MKTLRHLQSKVLIIFCLSNFNALSYVYCQDLIFLKTGDSLKVQIQEISKEGIRFKIADTLDGLEYQLPVDRIKKIVYRDGTEEVVQSSISPSTDTTSYYIQKGQLIPLGELHLIEIKEYGEYYYLKKRIGTAGLHVLFKKSNDKGVDSVYMKARLMKSFALMSGLTAIPVALIGVGMWGAFSNEHTKGLLIQSVATTIIYAGLEAGFVYFLTRYSVGIKRTVLHYNRIIAKHSND